MLKKNVIFAAITMFCAASCAEYDGEYTLEELTMVKNVKTFTKNFESRYGAIDPNHTWGFYEMTPVEQITTRSAFVNANQWFEYGLDVPNPLTEEQKRVVTEWFSTHQKPKGIAVNWTEYFAQQVSSTQYGRHMDYLLDAGTKGNDHVNNFNSGDCSYTNVGNRWQDKIMFMQGQSTKDFSYHETMSDKTWEDHYVIIPGEDIDPNNEYGLAGMYFLGFDYEAKGQSANQIVARDYYFNDWIIKISPGLRKGKDVISRIMCEDLGNTNDFDFNDVVFDVSYEKEGGKLTAIIALQAAGGTLPIYVGLNSESYEAHKLLGASSSNEPINVGETKSAVAIYRIEVKSTNPDDIPIYVMNGSNAAESRISLLPDSGKGSSLAPQKICIPGTDTEWLLEMHQIENGYKNFDNWVKGQSSEYDFDGATPWNKTDIDNSHLYK